MISSQKVITRVTAVVVTAAFAGLAHSQTTTSIPVPASSADSGSRAVVAITVPSTSDIQNIAVGATPPSTQAGTVCGIGTADYTEKKSGWSWGVASFKCNGASVSYSPGMSKWTAPCPIGFAGRTQGGALPYSSTVIAYCEKT